MKELDLLRQELLSCDTQLVDILMKRFDVVEKIMALKEKNQMQILQPEQESRQKEALDIELKGNIVLIGFMGAGKSTISAFLRDALAMDVVEMDQVIAEQQGMSISEIFETYGEEYFRNLETQLLIDMQSKQNVIISCGGGVAMRERNVAEMKKNGKVVLLKADPQTILDRVKNSDERPLLNGHKNVEYIADLMEARRAKYEAAADIVVQTDGKSALEICEEMIRKLRSADE